VPGIRYEYSNGGQVIVYQSSRPAWHRY
jgi:hypothetical protein